ncbi:PH domain-containing protein [Luteolibacter soli]|uniref:PH domain-containing protein n=1 Tax=Luteolibacter soli TaxID=3135280 RepID=A0ABU9B2X7_9BACT
MSAREQQAWFYGSKNGERVGPVTIEDLSALASRGEVGPQTLVWSHGYPDWVPAEQIADQLMAARAAAPVVAPPPVPVAAPLAEAASAATLTNAVEPVRESVAFDEPAPSSMPALELKPRKGSFVAPRIMVGTMISLLLAVVTVVILIGSENPPWPGLAVFIVGCIVSVIASLAAYRKERYELHDSRVICHRGGLASDQTTELEIRNITHVKLKLPWLRYKFYGVGNVIVETAGNSHPVVMRAIAEPEAIYAGVRERMKRNGYDLTQQQLFFEDKPAIIGVIVECLGMFFGTILGLVYVGLMISGASQAAKSPEFDAIALGLLGFVVLGLLAFVIVRFLDFRRRTYRVFNDMVVYDEGFLTRHNAFIPYENIADATTNCTFIDRLFGLYDVQVSCQGSSKDIKFRRLRQGAALSAAIDQLVVLAREKKKPAAKQALASHARPRRSEPEAVPAGEAMVAELGMHAGRALVPLLLLIPLVPLWLAAMIQTGIKLMSTQYSVRPGSVRHAYRFLTLTDREFAYDKITGVVVKQNLWDRMFGTLTIKFWSIGSGLPIEFAHVSASQLDVTALLRQAGIPTPSAEPCEVLASFGLFTWLRAQIKFIPLLLVISAIIVFVAMEIDPVLYYLFALPVLLFAGAGIYSKLAASRQRLRFHDHHVEAETGIIAKRFYMARYSNLKRTVTTRYPGGEQGTFQIFVAGEEEYQQSVPERYKKAQKVMRPCSFSTSYLANVRETALLLDDILCGRVDPVPEATPAEPLEVLLEAPRSVANAVLKLVLLSILLVPFIVLLPITLPFTIVQTKRWRYRIEATRIVSSWGVLYRRESSIILDRVDSIQQSQGPVNKMFKNGNVTIMTAGSSKPEFKIIDSPAYLELYRIIRERSE